jgi:hypothetical protein
LMQLADPLYFLLRAPLSLMDTRDENSPSSGNIIPASAKSCLVSSCAEKYVLKAKVL